MRAVRSPDELPAGPRPPERTVARQAAAWLVRLREGATAEDVAACERWRAAAPEHEQAWQRARQIDARFSRLPPGVGLAALGRGARLDRRAATKALCALLVGGPAGVAAYHELPWRAWTADQRTATGERRSMVLADGTQVDLNTSTALDLAFGAAERRVMLDAGEILVRTGSDTGGPATGQPAAPQRPFIVETALGRIRALGTRFVVRREADAGTDRVTVLQGAVEVTPAGAPGAVRVIGSGLQASFNAGGIGRVAPADPHAADWSHGVLFADGMRLEDFVAELGRYRPGLLRCDPAVAGLRITGAFQIDNTDAILAALPDTLPVRVLYRTRYWVAVAARA